MRLALLLIIAAETLFFGRVLGQVSDHYDYLTSIYVSAFAACDAEVERQALKIKECEK